jgi:glycosyltransferase involved in cell wall biosynthesis
MAEKKLTLTVAVAVMNEAANLRGCLSALGTLPDEIVIVDGGSSDGTADVAREFGAKLIVTDNPAMFHINKQKALVASCGDWILQLDADEIVTRQLADEVRAIVRGNPEEAGFYIPRRNYFLGDWLRKGGQYPDHVIRLVRRGKARFPCVSVHEQIIITGKTGYLSAPLIHNSLPDMPTYIVKAVRYARLTADNLRKDKSARGVGGLIRYLAVKPLTVFFGIYIRNKGFLDGWRGLLFAWLSSLHYPVAYLLAKSPPAAYY